jgi:ABC-type transport system involved in Fe-S cluster assembly fused permease/ATPase subunit
LLSGNNFLNLFLISPVASLDIVGLSLKGFLSLESLDKLFHVEEVNKGDDNEEKWADEVVLTVMAISVVLAVVSVVLVLAVVVIFVFHIVFLFVIGLRLGFGFGLVVLLYFSKFVASEDA